MKKNNEEILNSYLNSLIAEENKSLNTVLSYKYDIKKLILWLNNQNISLNQISNKLIDNFLIYCYNDLDSSSISRMIASMKSFSKYLFKNKYIDIDYASNYIPPKHKKRIPESISEDNITKLLDSIKTKDDLGIRDKAIIELIYSSGLRISEVVNLEFDNINLQKGIIRVIGKGNKVRILPLTSTASTWIGKYITRVRINNQSNCNYLFTAIQGDQLTRQAIWYRIKKHARNIGLSSSLIKPHNIRHSFATHLVNNGADLKTVQQLLGHSNLRMTQIYTHIAKNKIKEIHKQYHPREEHK